MLLLFLSRTIDIAYQVYLLMLFARIISSWIPEFRNTRLMQFIAFYTDPYLEAFRRVIPPIGMLDFSPILAFLALSLIRYMLKQIVFSLAFILPM
jgi:YggT family protein